MVFVMPVVEHWLESEKLNGIDLTTNRTMTRHSTVELSRYSVDLT